MYEFIQNFHSGWAYLVVLSSFILLVSVIYYFVSKKQLSAGFKKVAFYTVLTYHIQFLAGIVLYIVSPNIKAAWESGALMKDAFYRLIGMEHPIMMFTAVILITIANAKIKRTQQISVSILLFTVLAILCLIRIPWEIWMS